MVGNRADAVVNVELRAAAGIEMPSPFFLSGGIVTLGDQKQDKCPHFSFHWDPPAKFSRDPAAGFLFEKNLLK